MQNPSDPAGIAALSICKSLLLALNQRSVLPEVEIMGLLADAAGAHSKAPDDNYPARVHLAVADLIQIILAGSPAQPRH